VYTADLRKKLLAKEFEHDSLAHSSKALPPRRCR
jgi:hypothetical protein